MHMNIKHGGIVNKMQERVCDSLNFDICMYMYVTCYWVECTQRHLRTKASEVLKQ